MTPAEQNARTKRIAKVGVGLVLVAGVLRFTVFDAGSSPSGDQGLGTPGEETTDTTPIVTIAPVLPARNPFLPVNGG